MTPQPFRIEVPDAVLGDLRRRIARTRWPDQLNGAGWDYGTDVAYLRELADYWHDDFDWKAQERLLNSFSQFRAEVEELSLHFVHVKGRGPNPFPLIITHGWPSSFYEMYKVIGPLTDPAAHGGDPADAFDVVVPSLPGYGFSDRPRQLGMNVARIAGLFKRLMVEELGYPRFGAQGGDWGAAVTNRLGFAYPEHVAGISVTRALARGRGGPRREPAPEEREKQARLERFEEREYGYQAIQRTRPQTLAYGLNDSPSGLAGWIVEKWRRWSDCGGDVESVYTKDELLTNITLYWVTESINSSTRLYYEDFHHPTPVPKGERIRVPLGAAFFPRDYAPPSREGAERVYDDIRRWTVFESGGHFAAMERPDELVRELRELFCPLRDT